MKDIENWREPSQTWWDNALRYSKDKDEDVFEIDRAELLDLLMSSFVPAEHWCDRDSSKSMAQIGELFAYVVAGCAYRVFKDGETLWLHVAVPGFMWFEDNELSHKFGYVPTWHRLARADGKDWYS